MLIIRLANCADCGKSIQVGSRGPNQRVFCGDCRKTRAAQRRRVKNGVTVPVGEVAKCVDCQSDFVCSRGSPVRCMHCRKDRRRRDDRDRRRRLRAESPAYRISDTLKVQIRQSLRGSKSGRAWEPLVGFTLSELMDHLERQFLSGMSWVNHGEWHIDHIRPLCSFKFQTPDCPRFREAWALTNLRPIWAKDNLQKGGRRTLLL